MAPRSTSAPKSPADLPEDFHQLLEFAILASRPDPFDPMERAFHELGQRFLSTRNTCTPTGRWRTATRLLRTCWRCRRPGRRAAGNRYVIAAKGAPEAVARPLPPGTLPRWTEIRRDVAVAGGEGLRVLAVAKGEHNGPGWPDSQHDFDFAFLGLLGLADPLRPGVPDAVAACRAAGIRVA